MPTPAHPTSLSCGEWRGAQPFQLPHCCFLQKATHFHSPPSPSARRDGSALRPPGPCGAAAQEAAALSVPPRGSCPHWVCTADPNPRARTPAWCMGGGLLCLGQRKTVSHGGRGTPACTGRSHQGGVCPACPAQPRPSVCSVQIHLCQDPFRRQRPVGPDSPALPRAQQMGRPGPLPAAWPQAPALHPGCALQPPAGATP